MINEVAKKKGCFGGDSINIIAYGNGFKRTLRKKGAIEQKNAINCDRKRFNVFIMRDKDTNELYKNA